MRLLFLFLFFVGCSPAFAQTQLGPAKNLYLTQLARIELQARRQVSSISAFKG